MFLGSTIFKKSQMKKSKSNLAACCPDRLQTEPDVDRTGLLFYKHGQQSRSEFEQNNTSCCDMLVQVPVDWRKQDYIYNWNKYC